MTLSNQFVDNRHGLLPCTPFARLQDREVWPRGPATAQDILLNAAQLRLAGGEPGRAVGKIPDHRVTISDIEGTTNLGRDDNSAAF